MENIIKTVADDIFAEVVRLRRLIHQNPELAFEEEETARLVKETLQPLDLNLQTGIAKTGVMATIKGAHPGPTLMLRADMDALPIQEQNDIPFKSRNPGKMHACGHDAHTASLLGTAMILARLKDQLHGSVRMIFQPSEEKLPGGAKVMLEEGILNPLPNSASPEVIFGQHVQPGLPVGKIGVRNGMYMASTDEIYLTVKGTGGHAAAPHMLESDAVLVTSHVIVALQSVISRNCNPGAPSVLSFGKIIGDGATNIIPDEVRIEGTFRSMDESWRFKAHELIERVAQHTAQAYGARVELDIVNGYPALHNHDEPTDFLREAAHAYVGVENTVELDRWYASEDFAWYLQQVPGSFYRIGVQSEQLEDAYALHTPRFMIDEEALRVGPGFMAFLALQYGRNQS